MGQVDSCRDLDDEDAVRRGAEAGEYDLESRIHDERSDKNIVNRGINMAGWDCKLRNVFVCTWTRESGREHKRE
jgi:hypothetical protein